MYVLKCEKLIVKYNPEKMKKFVFSNLVKIPCYRSVIGSLKKPKYNNIIDDMYEKTGKWPTSCYHHVVSYYESLYVFIKIGSNFKN